MSDPFVAEIRIFPFNFAPKGWAFCNGQLLPISQNTALFSLLGTTYGGDGKSNFSLPNLEGSAPLHVGGNQPGTSLTPYDLGEITGSDSVTLLESEFPAHNHTLKGDNQDPGDTSAPDATTVFAQSSGAFSYATANPSPVQMASQTITPTGGNLPHNTRMPYLTLSFCIAMQGIFPPRA
jgi:microcystin-dependent protein